MHSVWIMEEADFSWQALFE